MSLSPYRALEIRVALRDGLGRIDRILADRKVQCAIFLGALLLCWVLGTRVAHC